VKDRDSVAGESAIVSVPDAIMFATEFAQLFFAIVKLQSSPVISDIPLLGIRLQAERPL
jgi:hypothetical protein